MLSESKCQNIFQKLTTGFGKLNGMTFQEVKKFYHKCGGTRSSDQNMFRVNFGEDAIFPPHKSNCPCGHYIKENCYVARDNKYESIITVGNCCIKFFDTCNKRICVKCKNEHKNKSTNRCDVCEQPIKKPHRKCITCNIAYEKTIEIKRVFLECEVCSESVDRLFEKKCEACFQNDIVRKNAFTIENYGDCEDCLENAEELFRKKCADCRDDFFFHHRCVDCGRISDKLNRRKCYLCNKHSCIDCNRRIQESKHGFNGFEKGVTEGIRNGYTRCFNCIQVKEYNESKKQCVDCKKIIDVSDKCWICFRAEQQFLECDGYDEYIE